MLRYQLPDGRSRIFSTNSAPIIASDGSQRGTLATFRDVTHIEEHREELEGMLAILQSSRDEITRKNRELEILATQDALTGCLNRRAFFEQFEQHWRAAKHSGKPLACVMVDNDHFKSVNDTYGHHTGDQVLRAVSGILRDLHGATDLVCRYGGEEFCIVFPGSSVKEANIAAEKIRTTIQAIRLDEPEELRITASIGVSDLSFDATDPQDLINQADLCLYVAKRQGRNQVVVFQPQFASMNMEEAGREQEEPEDEFEDAHEAVPFQAVTALVSALAYRDSQTAEHSRRVADLSVIAAVDLLQQRKIYTLEIAALLHDIGKIGVPDDILLKPGKLTDEEWKIMRQNDRIGIEIVAGAFNCDELTNIIQHYQTHFHPQDKKSTHPTGKKIPLASRILSVCDCYDSVTSDRAYRAGRSHEEAVAELRRCSGTQFDGDVVEHFIKKIEENQRSTSASGLLVSKQTALQIGLQIERLADAIDERDAENLQALASRLGRMARRNGVDQVADVAEMLEAAASDDSTEWVQLLGITADLLDLCRAAQNVFLSAPKESVSAPSSSVST